MNHSDYQLEQAALARAHQERCAASANQYAVDHAALSARYKADRQARSYLKTYIETRKQYPEPGTVLNTVDASESAILARMCEIDPRFSFDPISRRVTVTKIVIGDAKC